jgi:integrase/recombinase XerD
MKPIQVDVQEYLLWLGIHNYARTTIADRTRHLDRLVAFAEARGVHHVCEVTFDLLAEFQHRLFIYRKANGQPLTFGTQAQRLIPIQHFFSWLRRAGSIAVNPAADLMLPRSDRRLPEATLSTVEMASLLSRPDVARPLGLRDRAVLEVLYSCGLRRGELIGLATRDVDFERGTVFVRCGKGAKDRYVPIGERALFWLRLYIELARPGFADGRYPEVLFLSSVGTPICPDWLSRRVRRYLAEAGVEKRGSCHLLRHSVATLMLEGGADIRYVAEMLGHARLETTQRYTRVSIEALRAVHAASHPASGLTTAMAVELCAVLPGQPGSKLWAGDPGAPNRPGA